MQDTLIPGLAKERRDQMLREAEIYRLMADSANLTFGPGPVTRARRGLARLFRQLADSVQPAQDALV
jgi:hypothetical protein